MTRMAFDPTVHGETAVHRFDFLLLMRSAIHQFGDRRMMQECSDRLVALGYRSIQFDTSTWASIDDAVVSLGEALGFDTEGGVYYPEQIAGVAYWEYGGAESTGTVLCLFNYDAFRAAEPFEAWALLDTFAHSARSGLLVDHPMLVLIEAPQEVDWERVGCGSVSWTWALPSVESAEELGSTDE